jgi:hypothetical protein
MKKYMKNAKDKTAIAFALFLMFAMAFSLVALPTANAHTPPWTVPTYAFISVAPNPTGVGQQVTVVFWLDKVPIGAEGAWGDRWHNMKVTVTKPDGTNASIGTFDSDPNGGKSTIYTPDKAGNYTFYFEFPGQTEPAQASQLPNPYPYSGFIGLGYDYLNDTFTASSAKTTLTVQEEPVPAEYGAAPLPTSYWTRPINSMNREWAPIAGNWLGLGATSFGVTGLYADSGSQGGPSGGSNFDPYSSAPNSAHVMWTKPLAFGGQIGGEFGSLDTSLYATGTAYETKFGAVILNGILYYTEYPGAGSNPAGLKAVDLRTGSTVWEKNITQPLRCGMILNFITGDQYGGHAYLFTTNSWEGFTTPLSVIANPPTWGMYDAMTGDWILNIVGVQYSDVLVEGPNGEILCYYVNSSATTGEASLSMWNSTLCVANGAQANLFYLTYSSKEIWRPPPGATIPWSAGIQWSVPIPNSINGVPIAPYTLAVQGVENGTILLMAGSGLGIFSGGPPGGSGLGFEYVAGYNTAGQLLWGPENRTYTPFTTHVPSVGDGRYAEYEQQTLTWTVYDIDTGKKLFTTPPENNSWGYYDITAPSSFGYGNFYTWGLGGTVYCYDDTTGQLKWTWSAGNAGPDTPYGTWPLGTWSTHYILADGKLYVRAGHDYTPPVFKGAKLYCINATNGKEIFNTLSFDIVSSPALADGYMVWDNGYDNQIYCYGMGPSRTTVSAPNVGVTTATPVTITGTVTDISAGSQQNAVAANFPNGLPCVSDASMSRFMETVYQQQPMPANVTGVQVTISVLDSNGNQYSIGTTTTNAMGVYGLTWTPTIPGNFTVYATFAGSQSYYGSSASACFYASEAPAATSAPTPQPASLADIYFLPMSIVILIAIIVATIVIVLVLRKR